MKFIDPSRCIGCQACVQACGECDTHRGTAMIHLEYIDRTSIGKKPMHAKRSGAPDAADAAVWEELTV